MEIIENLRKAIENEKKAKKVLENMQDLKMKIDRLNAQKTVNKHVDIKHHIVVAYITLIYIL